VQIEYDKFYDWPAMHTPPPRPAMATPAEMSRVDKRRVGRIAFIDFEASSLGSASFPTEIGWAIITNDGSVESGSSLIRPPPKWTIFANAWSMASERLTGVTREMLDRDGLSPRDALTRFLEAVGARDLYTDEPDYDSHRLGVCGCGWNVWHPEG
jgi:hypothetical protein